MSISLFLSRIYDKKAPFITCKSLSGEVHTESEDQPLANSNTLYKKIISTATFFHDIGKAELNTQKFFHAKTNSSSSPNIDQIKHELSSFLILRFFSMIENLKKEDQEKEINNLCGKNGLVIKPDLESKSSLSPLTIDGVKKDFNNLLSLNSNSDKNQIDFNVIVESLVLFHHKLSDIGTISKLSKNQEIVGFNTSYLLGYKKNNIDPRLPKVVHYNFTKEELTSYFETYKAKMNDIKQIANELHMSADNKLLEYLFQLGRMIVITSDHRVSQLAVKNKEDVDLSGQLIAKSKGHGYQLLSTHLSEAETISNEIFDLITFNSFGELQKDDSEYLLSKPKNLIVNEKYKWQTPGLKFVQDNYSQDGLFCVIVSSTGSGKTRFGAELASTISPNLRLNVALGLRTLTLQTGTKYKEMYNLGDDKILTQIGDITTKEIYDANKSSFDSNMHEDDSQNNFDIIIDQNENNNLISNFPSCLETSFDSFSKKKYLLSPITISTVDFLIKAGDFRKSDFIVPQLRIMSSDLLLDEVDGYDPEDSLSLIRLCYTAGLHGRKLYLSTATAMTSLIDILQKAFLDGYAIYSHAHKKENIVNCFLITDEKDKQGYMNIHSTTNESLIKQYVKKYDNIIQKDGNNHSIEIKDINLKSNSKEEFLNSILNPKQFMTKNSKLGDFFNTSIDLAKNNHEISKNKHERAVKLSAGMIRVAHIKSGFEITMELLQDIRTYKKIKPTTKINVVFYHSSMSIQTRGYIEKIMDETLNRENGKSLIDSPVFRNQANNEEKKYEEIMTIFVVTPVEEVGRDHDFDWAIIEASSLRSIIQTYGRVNRHRMINVDKPNVIIMEENIALQRIPNWSKESPVYCFPGFEMKDCLFEDSNLNRNISSITIQKDTDKAIQFKSIDVLDPKCIMAEKEHTNINLIFENYYKHFKNLKHKMFFSTYENSDDMTGVFTAFRSNKDDDKQESKYYIATINGSEILTRDDGRTDLSKEGDLSEFYSLDFIDSNFNEYCTRIQSITRCEPIQLNSVCSKKVASDYNIFYNKYIGIIFIKGIKK